MSHDHDDFDDRMEFAEPGGRSALRAAGGRVFVQPHATVKKV